MCRGVFLCKLITAVFSLFNTFLKKANRLINAFPNFKIESRGRERPPSGAAHQNRVLNSIWQWVILIFMGFYYWLFEFPLLLVLSQCLRWKRKFCPKMEGGQQLRWVLMFVNLRKKCRFFLFIWRGPRKEQASEQAPKNGGDFCGLHLPSPILALFFFGIDPSFSSLAWKIIGWIKFRGFIWVFPFFLGHRKHSKNRNFLTRSK